MRLRMLNGINIFKCNKFQCHLADPYKVENQQKNKIKITIIMKIFGNYIHSILLYQIRHRKYINRYHGSNISIISA